MADEQDKTQLIELAVEVVSAFVSNNRWRERPASPDPQRSTPWAR